MRERGEERYGESCDGSAVGSLSFFVNVSSVGVGAFVGGLGVDYGSVFELVEDAFQCLFSDAASVAHERGSLAFHVWTILACLKSFP